MKNPNYCRAIGISAGEESESLPTVLAKGEQIDADQVVKIARRFGVPIIEHPALARLLDELPLDAEIPAALFEAVATILVELEKY
jgi:type III secretion system FlhB-like substrate exporter